MLGATVITDLREHRIPNRIVVPAAAACAALSIASGAQAAGLLLGAGIVLVLLAFTAVQPDALGMGDVKLAVVIVFGLDGHAAQALVVGFALAGVFGLCVILSRGRAAARTALPLAPFFAAGSLLALLA